MQALLRTLDLGSGSGSLQTRRFTGRLGATRGYLALRSILSK